MTNMSLTESEVVSLCNFIRDISEARNKLLQNCHRYKRPEICERPTLIQQGSIHDSHTACSCPCHFESYQPSLLASLTREFAVKVARDLLAKVKDMDLLTSRNCECNDNRRVESDVIPQSSECTSDGRIETDSNFYNRALEKNSTNDCAEKSGENASCEGDEGRARIRVDWNKLLANQQSRSEIAEYAREDCNSAKRNSDSDWLIMRHKPTIDAVINATIQGELGDKAQACSQRQIWPCLRRAQKLILYKDNEDNMENEQQSDSDTDETDNTDGRECSIYCSPEVTRRHDDDKNPNVFEPVDVCTSLTVQEQENEGDIHPIRESIWPNILSLKKTISYDHNDWLLEDSVGDIAGFRRDAESDVEVGGEDDVVCSVCGTKITCECTMVDQRKMTGGGERREGEGEQSGAVTRMKSRKHQKGIRYKPPQSSPPGQRTSSIHFTDAQTGMIANGLRRYSDRSTAGPDDDASASDGGIQPAASPDDDWGDGDWEPTSSPPKKRKKEMKKKKQKKTVTPPRCATRSKHDLGADDRAYSSLTQQFVCDVCNKVYACRRNLLDHKEMFNGQCKDLKSRTNYGRLSSDPNLRKDGRGTLKARLNCLTCHRVFADPRGVLYHEKVYKGECLTKGRKAYRMAARSKQGHVKVEEEVKDAGVHDEGGGIDEEYGALVEKLRERERWLDEKRYRMSSDTETEEYNDGSAGTTRGTETPKSGDLSRVSLETGYVDSSKREGEVVYFKEERPEGEVRETSRVGRVTQPEKVEPRIVRTTSGKLKKKYPCPNCLKELCSQNSVNEHMRLYKGKCILARLAALRRKRLHSARRSVMSQQQQYRQSVLNRNRDQSELIDQLIEDDYAKNILKYDDFAQEDRTENSANDAQNDLRELRTENSRNGELRMEKPTKDELYTENPHNNEGKTENSRNGEFQMVHPAEECKCVVCGIECTSMRDLMKHEATHEAKKKDDDTVQCHICGMIVRKTRMYPHLATHSARYTCDICGKVFHWKCEMTRHRRVHTKDVDYPCGQCDRVFKCRNSMIAHRRNIHVNERQFICSDCGRRFNEQHRLRRHTKFVHENHRPYVCELCDHTSSTSFNMRLHMKVHEKEARNAASSSVARKRSSPKQTTWSSLDAFNAPYMDSMPPLIDG